MNLELAAFVIFDSGVLHSWRGCSAAAPNDLTIPPKKGNGVVPDGHAEPSKTADSDTDVTDVQAGLRSILELIRDIRRELTDVKELLEQAVAMTTPRADLML